MILLISRLKLVVILITWNRLGEGPSPKPNREQNDTKCENISYCSIVEPSASEHFRSHRFSYVNLPSRVAQTVIGLINLSHTKVDDLGLVTFIENNVVERNIPVHKHLLEVQMLQPNQQLSENMPRDSLIEAQRCIVSMGCIENICE